MKIKIITGMLLALFFVSMMLSNVVLVNAIEVDIAPATLNVNNTAGNWITAYIEPSVLFKDTFSAEEGTTSDYYPNDPWNPVVGTWAVESGEYSQSSTPDIWQRSVAGPDVAEFVLTAKGEFIGGEYKGWVGVVFLHQGTTGDFYSFSNVYDGRNIARLVKHKPTYAETYWWEDVSFTPVMGQTYEYKVVVCGKIIKCYIDGQLLITKEDPSILPSGKIGLFSTKAHAHFDDVLLTDIDINDINADTIQLWDNEHYITDVVLGSALFGDHDSDSIPDLTIKFDRATVADHLRNDGINSGEIVELIVKAQLNGSTTWLSDGDSVRVIAKGKATF